MKYNIQRVTFIAARACLGGSSWFADVKQGGIESAEFDDSVRMVTLLTKDGTKIRIPAEGVAEIVYGATQAAAKT